MQVELCEIPFKGATEILRPQELTKNTYFKTYAATTKDEG
jgi:hypothetical protein